MIVKEGLVLCKRTGELVGFEHLTINSELNMGPNCGEVGRVWGK